MPKSEHWALAGAETRAEPETLKSGPSRGGWSWSPAAWASAARATEKLSILTVDAPIPTRWRDSIELLDRKHGAAHGASPIECFRGQRRTTSPGVGLSSGRQFGSAGGHGARDRTVPCRWLPDRRETERRCTTALLDPCALPAAASPCASAAAAACCRDYSCIINNLSRDRARRPSLTPSLSLPFAWPVSQPLALSLDPSFCWWCRGVVVAVSGAQQQAGNWIVMFLWCEPSVPHELSPLRARHGEPSGMQVLARRQRRCVRLGVSMRSNWLSQTSWDPCESQAGMLMHQAFPSPPARPSKWAMPPRPIQPLRCRAARYDARILSTSISHSSTSLQDQQAARQIAVGSRSVRQFSWEVELLAS